MIVLIFQRLNVVAAQTPARSNSDGMSLGWSSLLRNWTVSLNQGSQQIRKANVCQSDTNRPATDMIWPLQRPSSNRSLWSDVWLSALPLLWGREAEMVTSRKLTLLSLTPFRMLPHPWIETSRNAAERLTESHASPTFVKTHQRFAD